jgi:hypothetical protein
VWKKNKKKNEVKIGILKKSSPFYRHSSSTPAAWGGTKVGGSHSHFFISFDRQMNGQRGSGYGTTMLLLCVAADVESPSIASATVE